MFGNKRLETNVTSSSNFTGLCIKVQYIWSVFNFALKCFTILGFGDCTLQPGYAGREEIFSTLRGDENTHRERFQWLDGIESNHAPSSLTNKWIETWRRWRASERGEVIIVRPRLLEELESIDNTGLITLEEKSSIKNCLSRLILSWCQLRSKLNPTSHNSTGLDRNRIDRGRRNFKVVSRVGFPDVRSKWTTQRGGYLSCECEVVVPIWIFC